MVSAPGVDALHEVMTAAQRAFIPAPDTEVRERDGWFQLLTPSSGRAGLNEVSRSVLADGEADAVIDATLTEYRALGVRYRWRLDNTSRPLDLGARLERRGLINSPGVGVARTTAGPLPPPPAGVTVEEIDAGSIDLFSQVMAAGWDVPVAQVAGYHRLTLADPARRQRYLLARVGDEPAATSTMFVLEQSVMLQGGVVLPAFRRRGLYAAMVHARLAIAAALGRPLAICHARGDTSAPILAALGFATVASFHTYVEP